MSAEENELLDDECDPSDERTSPSGSISNMLSRCGSDMDHRLHCLWQADKRDSFRSACFIHQLRLQDVKEDGPDRSSSQLFSWFLSLNVPKGVSIWRPSPSRMNASLLTGPRGEELLHGSASSCLSEVTLELLQPSS